MDDSSFDTYRHINKVIGLLAIFSEQILLRGVGHDKSKLESPEKEIFDKYVPILQQLEFGSDEYKDVTSKMKIATNHHNSENRHHPEHFKDGIKGMNLIDIAEMFCDWKVATLRNPNGDLRKSIDILQERFGFSDDLKAIFVNSIDLLDQEEA